MNARTTFDTSRAAEFLDVRALQSQTGQPAHRFGDVVLKELLDNALDACETAEVQPHIDVSTELDGGLQLVTVTDNGTGIPPSVVERILNFNVLVSDKEAYRSPTRGMQGNALKTLLGMPAALGLNAPVVIEAHGTRHEITVGLDPGGNVRVEPVPTESSRTSGTSFTVPLPIQLRVDVDEWLEKFAIANPHAGFRKLANDDDPADAVFYKPTVGDSWKKPLPSDPTSPHWYDVAAMRKLVFAHIGQVRNGADDIPLGRFIRTFAGLSGSGPAKRVRAAVPDIEYLSDFDARPDAVADLLEAMKEVAKPPTLASLGHIGEDHLKAHLHAAYGAQRFWYKRKTVEHNGIGWMLEVAIAETDRPGKLFYATNYSPTFDDPLGNTRLRADDISVVGAGSFLDVSDAAPDQWRNADNRAAVVHVACAAPAFTDKGKVALAAVPPEVADAFAETIAAATKALRREHKRAERDADAAAKAAERARRRAERAESVTTDRRITLKEAVFAVMEEAIADASSEGTMPFPTRNILYAVRPLIQRYTDQELKKDYFGQTLVVEWEREHGPIPGHYRDPRGELREPHTGKVIRLGTREVAQYVLPKHVFDKILYVEKEGLNPIFEAAQLAERYDMAIASGKGQPVEAVRELFARAEAGPGNYKLFVLHDADSYGYTIRRAIAEETARMPNHRVEVIDLGLSVEDAIRLELQTERYTRKAELPWWMPERLSDTETEWFAGQQIGQKQWRCTRAELNALIKAARLVTYVEDGMARHLATNKVIPPPGAIYWHARAAINAEVRAITTDIFAELGLDIDEIADEIAPSYHKRHLLQLKQSTVNRRLRGDRRASPWGSVVSDEISRRLDKASVEAKVRKLIEERLDALDGRTDGAA